MPVAVAYVNHGRWIANCPFGCGGAERVFTDNFMCRECLNAVVRHQPIPLVLPDDEDIRAIEAALVVRPLVNRNWNPDESIGALLAENAMHGLMDVTTGRVYGDIGADPGRVPALARRLELTA